MIGYFFNRHINLDAILMIQDPEFAHFDSEASVNIEFEGREHAVEIRFSQLNWPFIPEGCDICPIADFVEQFKKEHSLMVQVWRQYQSGILTITGSPEKLETP